MRKFIAALVLGLGFCVGTLPAYGAPSTYDAKAMLEQQSFKLLELSRSFDAGSKEFAFASLGASKLLQAQGLYAHLMDLQALAESVGEPGARDILKNRWESLQMSIYLSCEIFPRDLLQYAQAAANAKVAAELTASKKVVEAACTAGRGALPE